MLWRRQTLLEARLATDTCNKQIVQRPRFVILPCSLPRLIRFPFRYAEVMCKSRLAYVLLAITAWDIEQILECLAVSKQ